MSSDEEDSGPRPDMEKVRRKMANVPTLQGLLAEKDPHRYTDEQMRMARLMVTELVSLDPKDNAQLQSLLKMQRKKYSTDNKKSLLADAYRKLLAEKAFPSQPIVEGYLVSKATRSQSGVLVVTVFTSANPEVDGVAQKFSCNWNCYYCPNEPGQPRSYLLNEPGVRRANQLGFDPIRQFTNRVDALVAIGHPADKVELLVLGGTWESYPEKYRTGFIRDLFYAANTYFGPEPKRPKADLLQEQIYNETAKCRMIGVTLETRPDTINPGMLVQLRQYGCTRVQLGVQHTDDSVLLAVNRGHTREDAAIAIQLLKDACFKVDIHLMPDLPGATPELDKKMFDDVLFSPDLQVDQWKIYPCQTTPFTLIKQWYEEGKYVPYGMDNLIDVILYVKRKVHPWIRLNRVIRDIPVEYVLAGVEVANLRQLLQLRLKKEGRSCQCIRCREVKGDKAALEALPTAVTKHRKFDTTGGTEIFLSVETPDEQILYGFLRLRIPDAGHRSEAFPELNGCALIRELHVYGNLVPSNVKRSADAQHQGIGKRLLLAAEEVALSAGLRKLAVISGVGVRDYYRRRGYVLYEAHRGAFLIKHISAQTVAKAARDLRAHAFPLGGSTGSIVLKWGTVGAVGATLWMTLWHWVPFWVHAVLTTALVTYALTRYILELKA